MSYAELMAQSNFSFLQGASHPEELVRRAAFLNYEAIAITDECSLAGVVRAHHCIEQEKLKLKLIIGSYLRYQNELELILICPNKNAYSELCRLITHARRRAEKGQYQLDPWDIRSLQHCLIIWLPLEVNPKRNNTQDKQNQHYNDHWGKWLKQAQAERLWLGYRRQLKGGEHHKIQYWQELAESLKLEACACGGALMHSPERQALQHIVSAIDSGKAVSELGRELSSNREACLRSIEKLHKLFPENHINNALGIARRCHFSLRELSYQNPSELVPKGLSAIEHLRQLVAQGCEFRFPEGTPQDIQITIDKELNLIEEQRYEYFFLTIYDIVQFAKKQKILYQGRGSAANSIVCYCLEITAVNPAKISVLFERFISKERNEPPDIDVDFESQRREEVIQYIYQKYGRERAALAATVITYRLKSALREVGKALGFAESRMDYFIKNINRRDSTPWPEQLQELGLDLRSRQSQQLVKYVEELRGFPRHLSQHVGGFVIAAGPLHHLVPVENAAMDERTVIQWDKDDLESLGLLKVDILSLGMLSAIRRSFDLIQTRYQHRYSIADIGLLPEDPQVYNMIQQADTIGVFQIESRAQMSMLPRLKPKNYYDLVVQIAIVRPGPIQGDMVHPYLKRRNGEEKADYPSEALRSVLGRTYGVPIFQEQVIQVAMVAAGFSGGEADQLRRAMASWKKTGQLHGFRKKLIDGMNERGYQSDYAERIFNQILGFGEYGFPESHSASFAILAYTSAWLKYYYPTEFCCALLNSQPMGFYSAAQLIQDARRHGVKVLPVCVQASNWEHSIEDGKLRLGLKQVKGLNQKAAEKIEQQRPNNLQELQALNLHRNSLEALASANALQNFSEHRFQARWDNAIHHSNNSSNKTPNNKQQVDLISEAEGHYQLNFAPNKEEDMLEDYRSLGLSLEHHPITLLRQQGLFQHYPNAQSLHQCRNGQIVQTIGLVTGRQSPGTASGVTFVTLEDEFGQMNIIVWAATARAQKKPFLQAKILEVKGIVEQASGVTHIVAGKLVDHSDLLGQLSSKSRDFH